MSFFKKKPQPRKPGIYKVEGNTVTALETSPGNGSINSITVSLGYKLSQVHSLLLFGETFEYIAVKAFTRQALFFYLNKPVTENLTKLLERELASVDWKYEYESDKAEGMFDDGIEDKGHTFEFLNSVIELKKESENLYLAPAFQLYLRFENDVLISFASSVWENTSSEWVKNVNEEMFNAMLSEAKSHHENEIDAAEEVNYQCEALRSIPDATTNEFISQHVKENGNLNFFNLWLAHYPTNITIDQFKLVNRGRFVEKGENTFKVDKFVYSFNGLGDFIAATKC